MREIPGRRFVNIADDVKLGRDVTIFEFVNLYGCEIGDESRIGAFVEIQRDATIGRRVRIQSHTFICSGVRIEDDVVVAVHDTGPFEVRFTKPSWSCSMIRTDSTTSMTSNTLVFLVRAAESSINGSHIVDGVTKFYLLHL